jgi:hypothetical protein
MNIDPSQDEYHIVISDYEMSTNVFLRICAASNLDMSNDAAIPSDGANYVNDTSQVTNHLRKQLYFSGSIVDRLQE